MNRFSRLAAATGALTVALAMGAASANERDRGPTSSSAPPPVASTPPSTSSTPPNTSYSTSRTTAPTDTSSTSAAASMQTDTSSLSATGRATGRPFAQFKDLDTNGDGLISADEFSANTSISLNLAMYDSNKDGKLSESEYARYKNQMARNNPAKSADEPKPR